MTKSRAKPAAYWQAMMVDQYENVKADKVSKGRFGILETPPFLLK